MIRSFPSSRQHARAGGVLALACSLLIVAGCAAPPEVKPPPPQPPKSYLVLLPNDDGTTGRVTYDGGQGAVELDQARQAVALKGSSERYTISADQLARDTNAAVQAQPKPPRTFLVYFESGDTRVNRASEALLAQVVEEVRGRPAPDISVIGHTDTVGTEQSNETLSLRRAEQVAQQVKGAVSSVVNVEITSHGERNLLVKTPDNTAEPRNRRVEITVR
jgi:outer membrane protein OmpA-like peptidoglycan-associated protein